MRPDSNDASYLWDMKMAAQGIMESITGKSLQDYLGNEDLKLATERRIEIIGEAANRVSEEFRSAHPEIPWKQIISQPNVLAHEYADIDDRLIWAVAADRITELIALLDQLGIDQIPPD